MSLFQQSSEHWVNMLRTREEWSPVIPAFLPFSHIRVALLEKKDPIAAHIFTKKRTIAQRYLNVNNDKAIADAMIDVLRKRYADGSFKIEFFDTPRLDFNIDSFADDVLPQVFHLTFRESLFAGGESHRRETCRLLNDAVSRLEE